MIIYLHEGDTWEVCWRYATRKERKITLSTAELVELLERFMRESR